VSISKVLQYKEGMTYMRCGNEEGGIRSFRTCGVSEEFEEPDSEGLGPGLQ
jgi:hypothetical protein